MEVKRFRPKYVGEVSSFLEKRFSDLSKEFQVSQSTLQEIFDHCKEDWILKQSKRRNALILIVKEGEEIVGVVVGKSSNSSATVALYSKIKKEVIKTFENWCKTKNFNSIQFIDYKKDPFIKLGYEEEEVIDDGYGNKEVVMKKEI